MSSISENLARKIASNNGVYIGEDGGADPQAFAVFKIENKYFGHQNFVVAYSFDQYAAYAIDHKVVEVLWTKDHSRIDSFNAELKESLDENY